MSKVRPLLLVLPAIGFATNRNSVNFCLAEAFEVIKRKPADIGNRKNTNLLDLCSSLCQPILRRLVEKGDCEHVDAFFDAIVSGGLAPLRNVLAGPLVTVRLRRNDLDAALESFCKCCEKYSLTPWRNELARALITAGDRYQLQKLMDYSMKIHGTDSTLHDMLQLLIEEGRVKEARKILQVMFCGGNHTAGFVVGFSSEPSCRIRTLRCRGIEFTNWVCSMAKKKRWSI